MITRHDDHQVPPSVTYHLTSLGKDLAMTMNQLFDWRQELYSKKEKMVEH
ncbi:winged helix-turn-helix transcriptional regulator [Lactobacillus helveticus]|nr:winged helix-turn-helix transcriptional regulator [Lactobacillus helveticus]